MPSSGEAFHCEAHRTSSHHPQASEAPADGHHPSNARSNRAPTHPRQPPSHRMRDRYPHTRPSSHRSSTRPGPATTHPSKPHFPQSRFDDGSNSTPAIRHRRGSSIPYSMQSPAPVTRCACSSNPDSTPVSIQDAPPPVLEHQHPLPDSTRHLSKARISPSLLPMGGASEHCRSPTREPIGVPIPNTGPDPPSGRSLHPDPPALHPLDPPHADHCQS